MTSTKAIMPPIKKLFNSNFDENKEASTRRLHEMLEACRLSSAQFEKCYQFNLFSMQSTLADAQERIESSWAWEQISVALPSCYIQKTYPVKQKANKISSEDPQTPVEKRKVEVKKIFSQTCLTESKGMAGWTARIIKSPNFRTETSKEKEVSTQRPRSNSDQILENKAQRKLWQGEISAKNNSQRKEEAPSILG